MSANWFIWHAEHKTPLVLIEELIKSYWKVLKPDGETVFVHKSHLTTRMY